MKDCFKYFVFNPIISIPIPIPNTKYVIKGNTLIAPYNFEEKLVMNCQKMRDITTIIFENCDHGSCSLFNQTIVLSRFIVELTFGYWFNKPIILTSNLAVLRLGHNFNKPIVLTPNIVHLTFGKFFNQSIILTSNIRVLTFGAYFSQPIVLTKKNHGFDIWRLFQSTNRFA